jgi:hypothetical protein
MNTNQQTEWAQYIGPIKGLNDNKRLIPLFEGKFNQFVLRNKGTDLDSPEAIIKLLNSRPRSFLKILDSLVLPLKYIDRNITSGPRAKKGLSVTNRPVGPTDNLTQRILSLTNNLLTGLGPHSKPLIGPINKATISMPLNLLYRPTEWPVGLNGMAQSLGITLPNAVSPQYLGMFLPVSSINPYQQNIQFKFNKANKGPGPSINNLFGLLEYAFIAMSSLISKPVYSETPDKINIKFFYFLLMAPIHPSGQSNEGPIKVKAPIATSYNGIELGPSGAQGPIGLVGPTNNLLYTQSNIKKLNILCLILSRIFKKPVELDLIRLHLPYFDDNILVKAIGIMSKDVNVRNIFNIIFTKTKFSGVGMHGPNPTSTLGQSRGVNSYLAGIKIRISGRLMTQRVIPRLTTRVIQKGAITRGKINYINSSRVNLKNKRGAHSITVTMSHLLA